MNKLKTIAHGFVREEDGATAVEYALLVALIGVAIIVGAQFLGTSINSAFSKVGTTVTNVQ
jgi:pilus assembly protein Flp/PilA